eukprot:TRINITY_DN55713_c0_g1_i2.p1 TRINITY_DN55713_c0_g1~~TRINITY_DN55713_c0_g1_i2.p1  ORF type:complete len:221 (-),score=4.40 TRINITY_DN55713_c0_g1_i2:158-820(-)
MSTRTSYDYDQIVKVLIIGDSGVGKSSLLLRFTDDMFDPTYIATIGVDFRIATIPRNDNQIVKAQLWDTAGQERFKTITQSYYRGAHAVALCFSVTDRQSLSNCEKWLQDLAVYTAPDIVKVLIGTKADLTDKRQVSEEEIVAFASQHGLRYVETSAKKDTDSVEKCFHTLIDSYLTKRKHQKIEDNKRHIELTGVQVKNRKRGCLDWLFGTQPRDLACK